MPRSVSLLAFDLDGTTIARGGRTMERRVQNALAAAHERGISTAVVTGRGERMIPFVSHMPWLDYLLTLNGALGTRRWDSKRLFGTEFAPAALVSALETLEPFHPMLQALVNGTNYMEREALAFLMASLNQTREGVERIVPGLEVVRSVRDVLEDANYQGVYKMQVTFDTTGLRDSCLAALRQTKGIECPPMDRFEIEVTAEGANKGAAVRRLCQVLGLDPRDTLAFGDDGNDITMAEVVGTFVAPADAKPEVLAMADETCPTAEHCGVAQWIESNLL